MVYLNNFAVIPVLISIVLGLSPSPALAVAITCRATTVSVDVAGMGAVQGNPSGSCETGFLVVTDGMADGVPVGMSGGFGLGAGLSSTDGWAYDQSEPPQILSLASITLYGSYQDPVTGERYAPILANDRVLAGSSIGGSGGYALSSSGFFASSHVGVQYGNDGGGYGFDVFFKVSDSVWTSLAANMDGLGGPDDNEYTEFDGDGAGKCSSQGLPLYWVNTSFLNLVVEDTDLTYQSYGHRVALRRVWNMFPARSGMFGNGWTFAYESRLTAQAYTVGGVRVSLGSGQLLSYAVAGSEGTGTVTVRYSSTAHQPVLTGYINQATGTGYYTLEDKERKLTSRYDYVQTKSSGQDYRLTSITDRNGNALTLTYDANGRLTQLTDASGRQISFTLDANGRCTGILVFGGYTASFAYDAAGNLTRSQDLDGNESTYAYDAANYLTSMTTAGKTTSIVYDTASTGRYVTAVTDALGRTTAYAFGSGETRVTEPGGGVRRYGNTKGRTTSAIDPLGYSVTATYNSRLLPVSFQDADWRQTTFAYDDNGNLTKITDPVGNETSFTYDGNWNLVSRIDANNKTWRFTYDSHDNRIAMESPLGADLTRTVNERGLLMRLGLPDGAAYDFTYDNHGNLTAATDPLGNATSFAYDAAGLNLTSRTDPRHFTTSFQYDANRRLTRTNLPDGSAINYGYNCCTLASVTDGGGNTTVFERDALLHITKITNPLGSLTRLVYNTDGVLTRQTDPLGRVTSYGRDGAQRLTSIVNPLGKQLQFVLNGTGQPTAVTNERGKTSFLAYDARGLYTSLTDPLGLTGGLVAWDSLDRLSSVTSSVLTPRPGSPPPAPVTRVLSYLYDDDGRLSAKRYDTATAASYVWDANGRLRSVTDAVGTQTFSRDLAGRITHIAYADGQTLGIAYDTADNATSVTYPGGLTVTTTYDGLNRPTGVSFGSQSLTLAYDASGHLTGESRSSGVQSLYGFDASGRLVSLSHKKGSTVIADLAYARDAAGQVSSESGVWPLTPRPSGTTASATYDAADQVATWKSDAYSYDTLGNLIAIRGSRTFDATYDQESRPTTLTLGGKTRTYTYDGLGNRVRIQIGTATRNLHHDHWGRVVFETDASGQVTINYIYAGNRLVASGTTAVGFRFHLQDKTGNTLALTDAAGAVVGRYAYSPYGAVSNHSGAATSFTAVGAYGVMDEGDALFFMQNRYYDATTGRFIRRDPIGLSGGVNLYRYAENNPISRIDPSGLLGEDSGGIDRLNESIRTMSGNEKLVLGGVAISAVTVGLLLPEILGAGTISAATIGGAEVTTTVGALCSRGQPFLDKLQKTYRGNIPGMDPRSSAGFDYIINQAMPANDRMRVFNGVLKYFFNKTGRGW
ncbi:MAG: RHS repeat-associated core domain-containing protein [Solidesulfovibrio sp.]|uniref:RHS repeat-associated core domain-containing protein n=1 Tax=Solidesulfovibrio sp. TaxID=2910990 RepID=UPI003158BEAF